MALILTKMMFCGNNLTLFHQYSLLHIVLLSFGIGTILLIFLIYEKQKDKELKEITKYIEEINRKNYTLRIDEISEDELSILKNEIYKTTVMLKEIAENSSNAKKELKKSLEDISHQIKTPITSMMIILDNLIDEPDMDKNMREDFVRDIKREVTRIHSLIQSLLKLSKLDSDTIHFNRKENLLQNIVSEAIKNVLTICDLKNIFIEECDSNDIFIDCDFMWQVEAITNIIKNCLEHSSINSKLTITYEQNNIYSCVSIRDYGDGIAKEDLPHIFERFYKGKNATEDSIGIGLALSKKIIESDNGNISVSSDSTGSEFLIKYFKV